MCEDPKSIYRHLGASVGALLLILVALYLFGLRAPQPALNDKTKVVMIKRTDTLKVLDTVLQTKIKYIKTAPDTIVIKKFDSVFLKSPDDTIKTLVTIGQERRCLECRDSLQYCLQKEKIDSETISKMVTMIPKTEKPLPIKTLAEVGLVSFSLGILLGMLR